MPIGRTKYEPQFGRVFEVQLPDRAPVYEVFAAHQDGTIMDLGDDLRREKFFRFSQGLYEGSSDLGTRVLCKGCPHALLQHRVFHPDAFSDGPRRARPIQAGCGVVGCACVLWEPSECRCYYGSGGNHTHPYRRWCRACKMRDPQAPGGPNTADGMYDDRAELTLPGPREVALPHH